MYSAGSAITGPPLGSANKVLLKHNHAYSFTRALRLLLCHDGSTGRLQQRPCGPQSQKYLSSGLLGKKFALTHLKDFSKRKVKKTDVRHPYILPLFLFFKWQTFFNVCLLLRKRERTRTREQGRGRERERQDPKQALC